VRPLAGVAKCDHYARVSRPGQNIDTINERARASGRAQVIDAKTRKGTFPTHLIYGFWRSVPSIPTSDLQFTFTPASYREGVQGQLDLEPGMTIASWQQRPDSRGYVRLRSADPFDAPIIQPNYLAVEGDRRVLLAAMKLARRLLKSKPLEPYYDFEEYPGDKVQTDAELLEVAGLCWATRSPAKVARSS
jgi:choline dehydrogenase